MLKHIIKTVLFSSCFIVSVEIGIAEEISLKDFSSKMSELLETAKVECHSIDGGVLTIREDAVITVDISGDGKLDEVLSHKDLECSTNRYIIGTGGGLLSFIIDGHVESFNAKAWKLEPQPFEFFPIPVLLLLVHGTYCGTTGIYPCVQALIWNDANGQFLTGKEYLD